MTRLERLACDRSGVAVRPPGGGRRRTARSILMTANGADLHLEADFIDVAPAADYAVSYPASDDPIDGEFALIDLRTGRTIHQAHREQVQLCCIRWSERDVAFEPCDSNQEVVRFTLPTAPNRAP